MTRDTRQVIKDTALDLFHRKGYTATGVLDITKTAGVPKGSFYHFFDSKESLAREVVEQYSATTRLDILSASDPSPLQRIKNHLEHIMTTSAEASYRRGCLLGNFSTEMPPQSSLVASAVDQALSDWAQRLAATIAEAQSAGEISTTSDANQLAQFLVAGLEGSLARAKVSGSQEPLDTFRDVAFSLLLA
ncbi:TetR/AcrR family transcriptional repressor of nem operon [Okibacterium sp. HSC-33S16]|uniref:TetR/AcrR family transcriptional regulator n=1 Tax=Okibacterium sp. HSC-33S16 TaxID=2910965 RepID=UPI0020A1FEB1|nr:TetR/AcrR family transcriptional regulator [Okibacterium sp. HSC-33S16]MCP2032327.1 TetR/AcrR family transcriptional repressor of nem operon [Okibacterium sp. HSC-33S16]